jgi:hypothetical protein
MTRELCFVLAAWLPVAASGQSPAVPEVRDVEESAQDADGVELLFDGRTLDGWDGDPRLWRVEAGVIRGETTAENPANGNTFLIWQGEPVTDFELRLAFRCTAANNSGVQYRSRMLPGGRNAWAVAGYQHEIRNENQLPNVSGFIYDEAGGAGGRQRICLVGERARWPAEGGRELLETLVEAADFKKLMRIDDWNDVVIRAEGNRLRHYLNGRLILDFTDEHPAALSEGLIALQLHAGKPMWVEFRDLRLKRL